MMKSLFVLIFASLLAVGNASIAVAQEPAAVPPVANDQDVRPPSPRDYSALIPDVFAPITDQLNLTKEQEFQIVATITGTEVKAVPLIQELNDLDQQLTDAALVESPDESVINQLSEKEALMITQILTMKTRVNAAIYHLLTPGQRSLVSRAFAGSKITGHLGSISVY